MDNILNLEDIKKALIAISNNLSLSARETILFENFGKHILEISLILNNVGGNGNILDVGGGLGINLLCIKNLCRNLIRKNKIELNLYLLDKFEEYTKENRMGEDSFAVKLMENEDIKVYKQDFWINPVLPFKSNFFDLVTILDVTEHLPGHPLKILSEIKRVLKPGGKVILGGPNAFSLMKRIRFLLGKHPHIPLDIWIKEKYFSHYREYGINEHKLLLEKVGFKILKVIPSIEPLKTQIISWYKKLGKKFFSVKNLVMCIIFIIKLIFTRLRPSVYLIALND